MDKWIILSYKVSYMEMVEEIYFFEQQAVQSQYQKEAYVTFKLYSNSFFK